MPQQFTAKATKGPEIPFKFVQRYKVKSQTPAKGTGTSEMPVPRTAQGGCHHPNAVLQEVPAPPPWLTAVNRSGLPHSMGGVLSSRC